MGAGRSRLSRALRSRQTSVLCTVSCVAVGSPPAAAPVPGRRSARRRSAQRRPARPRASAQRQRATAHGPGWHQPPQITLGCSLRRSIRHIFVSEFWVGGSARRGILSELCETANGSLAKGLSTDIWRPQAVRCPVLRLPARSWRPQAHQYHQSGRASCSRPGPGTKNKQKTKDRKDQDAPVQ